MASHPHSARERDGAGGAQRGVLAAVATPVANPLEPKWVPGKRAVGEPDRGLRVHEREACSGAYYGCDVEAHLVMPETVS